MCCAVKNWYLLGVKIYLSYAYQTRFWYFLVFFLKISDEHPCCFYIGLPLVGGGGGGGGKAVVVLL